MKQRVFPAAESRERDFRRGRLAEGARFERLVNEPALRIYDGFGRIGRRRKSDDPAGIAVKREGHGEERLQRITLRAAIRRDVGFAGAHAAHQRMTHL